MLTREKSTLLDAYEHISFFYLGPDVSKPLLKIKLSPTFDQYYALDDVVVGQKLMTAKSIPVVAIGTTPHELWIKHPSYHGVINIQEAGITIDELVATTEELLLEDLVELISTNSTYSFYLNEKTLDERTLINPIPLGDQIGAGHFGKVYLGKHPHQNFAIKEIPINRLNRSYSSREFKILNIIANAEPKNPFVVGFVGCYSDEWYLQFVFERANSCSLETFYKQNNNYKDFCLTIIMQLAEALAFLHKNFIVHCDIKPDNVLLNGYRVADQQFYLPLLIDFGISRIEGEDTYRCGTPVYMAPETVEAKVNEETRRKDPFALPGDAAYCPATYEKDIFSFGMLILELITRKHPFGFINNTLELAMFLCVSKKIPNHPVTAASSPTDKKMASIYTWCCQFTPRARPPASNIVAQFQYPNLADITDQLAPFCPK